MTSTVPSLVVMYHYVRPRASLWPAGIRPLPADEFEAQLDWISQHYEILPAPEFLQRIRNGHSRRPACLLTFDDGTRDHFQIVLPILHRRGLSGVFFVLTWPGQLGRMPSTHALHWLLGRSDEELLASIDAACGSLGIAMDAAEADRIYAYEEPLRARIKYAINMLLPPDVTEQILAECLEKAGTDEACLAKDWFMSTEQIAAMHRAGMTIGVHGCSHRSLQALGADGVSDEIGRCSAYVADVTGERPSWYACPFGGSSGSTSAVDAVREAMEREGLTAGVTTMKNVVGLHCDVRALPRLDAIDLPPRGDWTARCGLHA